MSGEFCPDCPDHEGCSIGIPCEDVKKFDAEIQAQKKLAKPSIEATAIDLMNAGHSVSVQWGVRYKNLEGEPVYISMDGIEAARKSITDGDVLVYRMVTTWDSFDDE